MSDSPIVEPYGWCSADRRISYIKTPTGWFPEAATASVGGRVEDKKILSEAGLIDYKGSPLVRFGTRAETIEAVTRAFADHSDAPSRRIARRALRIRVEGFSDFGLRRHGTGWRLEIRHHINGMLNRIHAAGAMSVSSTIVEEWIEISKIVYPTRRAAIAELRAWLASWDASSPA